MVVRVAERASQAEGIDELAVATDDERIAQAVRKAGFRVLLTSPDCRNGTERIAQAARDLPADGYLNIQGDEPLVEPAAVAALARLMRSGVEMGTLARKLEKGEEDQPSVVKVVLDSKSRALYFSRARIPFPRSQGEVVPLAHLGLYGFSASFLQTFAQLPETPLERCEGLEQLRALFHGHPIQVEIGPWQSVAVDTAEDLEIVRQLWRQA